MMIKYNSLDLRNYHALLSTLIFFSKEEKPSFPFISDFNDFLSRPMRDRHHPVQTVNVNIT